MGRFILCVSEIPKTEIKRHTAAKLVSYGSNTSCRCRGNCATKHCPCRLRRFHCNSGCHPKVNGKCINNDISKIHSHCPSPPPKRSRKLIQKIQSDPLFNPSPIPQRDHSINKEFKVDANFQERITISSQNDVGEQSIQANDICSQEFSTNHLSDIIDSTNSLSLQFSTLEHYCVDWGGDYKDTKLVNTCYIDNFITRALRSRSLRDGSLSHKGRIATFVRSCSALRASKRPLKKLYLKLACLITTFGCWNQVNRAIFEICLLYENNDNKYLY